MRLKNRQARGRDAGGWRALSGAGSGSGAAGHGAARAWLRETGSLTARLQQRGPTAVQLLHQGLRRPPRDEWRVLRLAAGRRAPVREVVLRVAGRVAVFAHTVANRAAWKLLQRAGRRPLATVLFTDPRVRPGPLHYRQLDARHALYRAAIAWCEGRAAGPPGGPARAVRTRRGAPISLKFAPV